MWKEWGLYMNIMVTDSINSGLNKDINKDINNKESEYPIYSKQSLINATKNNKVSDNGKTDNISCLFKKEKPGVLMDNGNFEKKSGAQSGSKSLKEKLNEIPNAKLSKDYMTVMSNTMTKEDYRKLKEDGYSPISDDPAEMVNVSDRIKAEMLESGKVIAGYNDDLTRDELATITGSDIEASYLYESLSLKGITPNDTILREGIEAVNKAMSIDKLSRGAIDYMVRENMEPTIANLYMQKFSYKDGEAPDKIYYKDASGYMNVSENMTDNLNNYDMQIAKIMESYNIEESEDNIALVKDMVNENLAITDKSFDLYKRLRILEFPIDEKSISEKITYAIESGRKPEEAVYDEEKPLIQKALDAVTKLQNISDEAVTSNVVNNKPFNIRSLAYESKYIGVLGNKFMVNGDYNDVKESPNVIKAMRVMNEIRISMTVSSTYTLMKNGIDVNTRDLNLLVEDLKEAENRQFESIFGKNDSAKLLNDLYEETTAKVADLKDMPVAAFKIAVSSKSYTLNMVYKESLSCKEQYIRAGKSYETMATNVRRDLGDSIKKAFGNISEILNEIKVEDNDENQRAARILGYNRMEINVENLEKIKEGVNKVKNIIDKMNPKNVIALIREGINPLETDMNVLNNRLNEMDKETDSVGLFSEYLVKLDDRKEISLEERSSYIGIFRLIKNIEKDDMAAVGTLINSKAEINFKNLLSAIRLRKASGLDMKIGKDDEIINRILKEGASISDQIGKAFVAIGNDGVKEPYLTDYEKELIDKSALVNEDVTEFLLNENVSLSVENLLSADNLLNSKNSIYGKVRELINKSNSVNVSSNDNDDNEKISVAEYDEIIKDLQDVNEEYEDVYNNTLERLSEFINDNSDKLTDINTLRELSLSLKGLNLNKRLSQNDIYEVPIQKGDQVYSVKFRFIKGNHKGVSLVTGSEKYGELTGRFEYKSNHFEGTFYYENSHSSKENIFDELTEKLMREYKKIEIPVDNINFLENTKKYSSSEVNVLEYLTDINNKDEESQGRESDESTEAISKKVLYNLAKVFIEIIGS